MAMLRLTELIPATETLNDGAATRVATLTLDERRRSRLLIRLDDGSEAAVTLPRGSALRDGDRLRGDPPGVVVIVRAAAETLSVARTPDRHLLTRAAYHLGNRHVPLQIGDDALWYEHDHVLDDLARTLGLDVSVVSVPFQPEGGGYGGGRHEHGPAHGHGHSHGPGGDHHHHDAGRGHDHDHDH